MKHLLYLNREYLYSYYAQAFDGIDRTHSKNVTDATISSEDYIAENVEHSLDFKLKIPFAEIGTGKNTTEESTNSRFVTLEAAREVATISLHDNALNKIIDHSHASENSFEIGNYVIKKGNFHLVDIQHWIDILSNDMIDYIAEHMWDAYIRQLPNPSAPAVQRGKKAYIDEQHKNLLASRKNFEAQCAIANFDVLMLIDNIMVPIKREYLKESTKEIVFKYESEVSVFGQITRKNRKISNNSIGPLGDLTTAYSDITSQFIQRIGLLQSESHIIIDPISIYVE